MTILDCPDTIQFQRTDRLEGKDIGAVFSACTGHSISESVPLKLQLTSPFELAENVCLFHIDGVTDFAPQNFKPKSQIEIVGSENTLDTFTNKLYDENASVVHVNLNDGLEVVSILNYQNFAIKK